MAGAAIFGSQTDTHTSAFSVNESSAGTVSLSGGPPSTVYSSSFSSSHSSSFSSSFTKTVLDLQASAGVDFYLSDTNTLTFGYQAEELTNVGPGANSGVNKLVSGTLEADRVSACGVAWKGCDPGRSPPGPYHRADEPQARLTDRSDKPMARIPSRTGAILEPK